MLATSNKRRKATLLANMKRKLKKTFPKTIASHKIFGKSRQAVKPKFRASDKFFSGWM